MYSHVLQNSPQWKILVYMINKRSPKRNVSENFFSDRLLIKKLLIIIEKFRKIHIENQNKAGATINKFLIVGQDY